MDSRFLLAIVFFISTFIPCVVMAQGQGSEDPCRNISNEKVKQSCEQRIELAEKRIKSLEQTATNQRKDISRLSKRLKSRPSRTEVREIREKLEKKLKEQRKLLGEIEKLAEENKQSVDELAKVMRENSQAIQGLLDKTDKLAKRSKKNEERSKENEKKIGELQTDTEENTDKIDETAEELEQSYPSLVLGGGVLFGSESGYGGRLQYDQPLAERADLSLSLFVGSSFKGKFIHAYSGGIQHELTPGFELGGEVLGAFNAGGDGINGPSGWMVVAGPSFNWRPTDADFLSFHTNIGVGTKKIGGAKPEVGWGGSVSLGFNPISLFAGD